MRRVKTCAVLAAALLGMCAGSAYAQEMVVARVPFPFAVRGQQFAAGRYSITTEEGVVTVRGIDTSGGAVALTVPTGGQDPIGDQPALVFVRYENEYRLSQVWPSSTEGPRGSGSSRRSAPGVDRVRHADGRRRGERPDELEVHPMMTRLLGLLALLTVIAAPVGAEGRGGSPAPPGDRHAVGGGHVPAHGPARVHGRPPAGAPAVGERAPELQRRARTPQRATRPRERSLGGA